MISRLINTNSKGTSFSIIIFNCVTLMIFLFTVLKKTPLGSGTLLSVMLLLRPLNFFVDYLMVTTSAGM
jgi:hypothetical protein